MVEMFRMFIFCMGGAGDYRCRRGAYRLPAITWAVKLTIPRAMGLTIVAVIAVIVDRLAMVGNFWVTYFRSHLVYRLRRAST